MLENPEILSYFLYAVLVGIFIGTEREYMKRKFHSHKSIMGIRTFILISIFGALSGYLSLYLNSVWMLLVPFLVLSAFILLEYAFTIKKRKTFHTTTEICAFIVFVLSAMSFYGLGKIAVSLSILIAVLLSSRLYLHHFIQSITKKELGDTLKFAIIALVILPFLPDKEYGPLQVLNPYHIWLMVVFISGVSFVGYVLVKRFGAKEGISITGLVGGLVSSTAVAITFSEKSKKASSHLINAFALAIIIASTTMFLRILFEVLIVNRNLLSSLIVPLGIMCLTGIAFSYYYLKIKKKEENASLNLKSPFTLGPALKFGIFFAFILLISKAAQVYWGSGGVYLASIFSGLADVDAITLSMSKFAADGLITEKVASSAITLAALSNTIVKGCIVYIWGSNDLKKKIAFVFSIIILMGVLSILFL